MPTPTTVHQALLQAVAAALAGLPGVASSSIFVELPSPVDAADCPAVNITGGPVRFDNIGSDGADFDLVKASAEITIRLHTRGAPHTQVADPFIGAVHAALMADPSLGGRALRLRLTNSRATQAPADGTAGTFELAYEVVAAVDERTLAIVTQ